MSGIEQPKANELGEFDHELQSLTNYSIAKPELTDVIALLDKYVGKGADMSAILTDQTWRELSSYSGDFTRVDDYIKWAKAHNIVLDVKALVVLEIHHRKVNLILHPDNMKNILAYGEK